jgi:hypothetical protein
MLKSRWILMLFLLIPAGLARQGAAGQEMPRSPVPVSSPSIVPLDGVRLRTEFIRALQNEVKAMRQRHRGESADLKASQKARRKDFERRERDERRAFFKANPEPARKREYVRDFVLRRKALSRLMVDELKTRRAEHRAAERALTDDQKRRLKEFDEAVNAGQRPDDGLWPQAGR